MKTSRGENVFTDLILKHPCSKKWSIQLIPKIAVKLYKLGLGNVC